jgi:apolipoprotein N-acyltransferase
MPSLVRSSLSRFTAFASTKHGLWIACLGGVFYALAMPPFNRLLHPAFTFFPLLSFFACLPLFLVSLAPTRGSAALRCYLFGFTACVCQFYWIAFVVPEGLWHLVVIGVCLICLYEGLYFLLLGLLFRFTIKRFPALVTVIFPALWVIADYQRTLGEISFPWNFAGYSLAPLLPLAQLASITGVFGLTYVVILGNVLAWKFMSGLKRKGAIQAGLPMFALALSAIAVWGYFRMQAKPPADAQSVKIAMLQGNIDQNHWTNGSLDSSFAILESLLREVKPGKPDFVITPESALLCYLLRRPQLSDRVTEWSRQLGVPIIVGALHWDPAPRKAGRDYYVYNTAFLVDPVTHQFSPYYKMQLVPFSETLPFTGVFPILSRVNLGQADFKSGTDPVVFTIGKTVRAAPFICYEIIYPRSVRARVVRGANLLVNITNDGWFGKSSGAFQHATMARLRTIENGVPLARDANTGITMFVDQYGRILKKTELYERTFLDGDVRVYRVPTFYAKVGDWPVLVSALVVLMGMGLLAARKYTNRKSAA